MTDEKLCLKCNKAEIEETRIWCHECHEQLLKAWDRTDTKYWRNMKVDYKK